MSKIYVTGPVEIYVGTGVGSALEFLGYSERGIRPAFRPYYSEVYTDVGGPNVPDEIQLLGEEAMVSATLVRYNEAVLKKLAARIPGNTPGAVQAGQLGTLMFAAGASVRLLLNCRYAGLAQFSDMIPALNFPRALLADSLDMDLAGVEKKANHVVFRCFPVLDRTTSAYTLYDYDTTGIVAVN